MNASTIAGIAGAALALGAVIASALHGKSNPSYEVHNEGPTTSQYTPQHPVGPMMPPPQPVYPYASMYPWGYNAYIATIANTPMTSNYTAYGQMPYNVYGTYCGSPQVYTYNYHSNGGIVQNTPYIRPSPMGAPPGNSQPIYTYDFSKCPSYVREYGNGSVSFAKVPYCYNDDGTWRGW